MHKNIRTAYFKTSVFSTMAAQALLGYTLRVSQATGLMTESRDDYGKRIEIDVYSGPSR
jgi:hypothetical protein